MATISRYWLSARTVPFSAPLWSRMSAVICSASAFWAAGVLEYWKASMHKPMVAFVAGRTAPAGKRMGHAGAIVGGADDTADAKLKMLASFGIHTVDNPSMIGQEVANVLAKR